MAETTIAWTGTPLSDGTSAAGFSFNPWTGCTRVSPGCDFCYAATLSKRNSAAFGSWEPGAERKRTSAAYWRQPLKWNRQARSLGVRLKVFCASMADVFDTRAPAAWREALWDLIRATPDLDWLLLTKRPQNIAKLLPADWGDGWPNVWIGCTAENQVEVNRRIQHLLAVPAVIRFLSCEPLLSSVTLPPEFLALGERGWCIVGGESGSAGVRVMEPDWAASLLLQCQQAGVPAFFKQWGSARSLRGPAVTGKGDDPAEWPPSFRIQQFPHPVGATSC